MPTKIEWCEESWNPISGCNPISEGCQNCYAKRMAQRLKGRFGYPEEGDPFVVTFKPGLLDRPLRWKKPRMIFVCSMGDLFHDDIADHQINSVFLTMLHADWHTYLILTKRPERMADFVSIGTGWRGMMPHVWLGVTAELDKYLWRIEELLKIPAAKRFVSIEPMLGPVDLAGDDGGQPYFPFDNEEGTITPGLDWVILGGESGPGARPMHPDWVRSVRDQCQEAGAPFFFKQWGEWLPMSQGITIAEAGKRADGKFYLDQQYEKAFSYKLFKGGSVFKVGKKKAGRLLDGKEHSERP